jgi:hypothetical protein
MFGVLTLSLAVLSMYLIFIAVSSRAFLHLAELIRVLGRVPFSTAVHVYTVYIYLYIYICISIGAGYSMYRIELS